ncbi:MAG: peroxiredoxin [Acidimicrobiales bacterium]
MTIAVGDKVPDVSVMTPTADGPKPVQTGEVLGHGKVVLFAVPGAFTPTCSDHHLPGFVLRAADLKAKGAATIACVAVNDAFVLGAWGKARGVGDDILMLADGNGDFATAMGLALDGRGLGMGLRSQRYLVIAEDGVVTKVEVESSPGALDVSSADAALAAL